MLDERVDDEPTVGSAATSGAKSWFATDPDTTIDVPNSAAYASSPLSASDAVSARP